MILNDLKGKRILLTGHTGFKGSWLGVWLHKLGAKVAGYSLYIPSEPSHFQYIPDRVWEKDIRGDIRDFDSLKKVFDEFRPEVVFHLAASPIVRHCIENPLEAYSTNIMGTANVLECVRKTESVQAAVMITSDKCYENVEWIYGYRETDQLGGKDPYSSSKAGAELVISTYFRTYLKDTAKKVASARAGNVIGGGDWAKDRIIPDAIKAWGNKSVLELRSPNATRPWQHVLEPLGGYLLLACELLKNNSKVIGESFNFGPKEASDKSVQDIISFLAPIFSGQYKVSSDAMTSKEAGLLKLNCDKALSFLNWKATLNYDETLEFTGSWYKEYLRSPESVFQKTIEQIDAYVSQTKKQSHNWMEHRL